MSRSPASIPKTIADIQEIVRALRQQRIGILLTITTSAKRSRSPTAAI